MKSSEITFDGVKATGVLTLTGQPLNTETVVVDSKTYTFQTTLTDVDGNVLIGTDASDSLDNLIAAITLGAGSGTKYAASMTLHPTVTAVAGAGDTMDAEAKSGGTGGNVTSTETLTNGSWDNATLTGGARDTNTVALQVNEAEAEIAVLQLVGTFSGNVEIEGTVDGTNYVALEVLNAAVRLTVAATMTAAGIFEAQLAGLAAVRIGTSAWVSGSVAVTVQSVRR